MTNISIAYQVPAATVERIKSHLDSVSRNDPNWNGANFKIVRDDFTCIPDDDSHNAASLLIQIQKIIYPESD